LAGVMAEDREITVVFGRITGKYQSKRSNQKTVTQNAKQNILPHRVENPANTENFTENFNYFYWRYLIQRFSDNLILTRQYSISNYN
jgi:hypothetical protein